MRSFASRIANTPSYLERDVKLYCVLYVNVYIQERVCICLELLEPTVNGGCGFGFYKFDAALLSCFVKRPDFLFIIFIREEVRF